MPARTKSVRVVQGLTSDSGPAGTREVVANGTVSQPETLPSPPPPPLLNLVSRWLHFRGELHSLFVSAPTHGTIDNGTFKMAIESSPKYSTVLVGIVKENISIELKVK